ncbi:MAG: zinc ABC transporter substrate-binding protein [Planctomycetes bacterium]|nr:zinc ABC transporter substrate-binding protein [Planctomycetota bacterium]
MPRPLSSVLAFLLAMAPAVAQAARHAVVAATPDLAALCRRIGGERLDVTALVVGPQDPHYLDPRPTMLYALQEAELLVETGRDLESGWLPVLVRNSRNGSLLPGQLGRLDASRAVRALNVPAGALGRLAGDVHPGGNPHYLLDPLCGLEVAAMLRDRCAALWPAEREEFLARFAAFRADLATAMVGPGLAPLYEHDAERLALAFGNGTLVDMLREQGDLERLEGWFAAMAPHRGARVVTDHDLWPYFAERFGLSVFGYLEPRPGVTPTTAHLEQLAARMRQADVRVILTATYFPRQHATALQQATGARIVAMAHQPGARPGTDDYVDCIGHNVRVLAAALAAPPKAGD